MVPLDHLFKAYFSFITENKQNVVQRMKYCVSVNLEE